jgi:predicted dienelactone hydrolase
MIRKSGSRFSEKIMPWDAPSSRRCACSAFEGWATYLRKVFWPGVVVVLFCLASSANAAGIQLFNHGPNLSGNSAKDSAKSDDLSSFLSRPADMVRLLDFLLHDWKDRDVVDPIRIGLFGFSKGGYTGLALIGAAPDFGRFARGCTDGSKLCEQLSSGDIPAPAQDVRIRAAVIADPIPGFFTQSNLATIKIPVQFWRAAVGIGIINPDGTERVAGALPGKPEVHSVAASHFAFLAPCAPQLTAALPRICTDKPADFDRSAFHREFNASVAHFFHDHLVLDDTIR